jgi:hypothetical protein
LSNVNKRMRVAAEAWVYPAEVFKKNLRNIPKVA